MSLLADIQNDAIDVRTPLSVLLRRCLVLAARLENQSLKTWAQAELEGYPDEGLLPTYRRQQEATVQGDFSGPANFWWQGAEIPRHIVDSKYREALFSVEFRQGVAEFESLLATDGNSFQVPWPTDAVSFYGERIYDNLNCVKAWRSVPRSAVEGVLDQIRNKVLTFALEIEALDPSAGEAPPGSSNVDADKVTHIFQNVFYGSVGAVGIGNATQTLVLAVMPGDKGSLVGALRQAGIPDAELSQLDDALDPDGEVDRGRVLSWQESVIAKVHSGAIVLTEGISVTLVADAISRFLGLS